MTAALWVGANVLFDQPYAHWTRFNTLIGAIVGFLGYFLSEANGLFRSLFDDRVRIAGQGMFDDATGWRTQPLDINGLLWGLIGAAAGGLVMFLLSAPRGSSPASRWRWWDSPRSGSSRRTPSTSRRDP